MKKLLLIIFAFAAFFGGFYYLVKYYYHVDTRLAVSLLKPPSEDIARHLPQGSDLTYPLSIPKGLRLGVFANLKAQGVPRVLAFDPKGVLFTSMPKAGKVVALPDRDGDGIADETVVVLDNLNKPHGMVFRNGKVYIAETDKVTLYDYDPANLSVNNREILFTLPGAGRHFTRTIKILEDKLYTSVGSSCDVCIEKDERYAAILESDLTGDNLKVFAKGLRNTVFFVFDEGGRLWGNDMGRDFLGDELPPDELNIVKEGKNYGWPDCYGKKVHDIKFRPLEALDFCGEIEATTFDYPAHVAPLGLAFIESKLFASNDQGNLLVAFHGSWNSSVPVGYKVVKLEISGGKVVKMEDFIAGWLEDDGGILGRPVDLIFDENGVLYISDDKAGLIYILTQEL